MEARGIALTLTLNNPREPSKPAVGKTSSPEDVFSAHLIFACFVVCVDSSNSTNIPHDNHPRKCQIDCMSLSAHLYTIIVRMAMLNIFLEVLKYIRYLADGLLKPLLKICCAHNSSDIFFKWPGVFRFGEKVLNLLCRHILACHLQTYCPCKVFLSFVSITSKHKN